MIGSGLERKALENFSSDRRSDSSVRARSANSCLNSSVLWPTCFLSDQDQKPAPARSNSSGSRTRAVYRTIVLKGMPWGSSLPNHLSYISLYRPLALMIPSPSFRRASSSTSPSLTVKQ